MPRKSARKGARPRRNGKTPIPANQKIANYIADKIDETGLLPWEGDFNRLEGLPQNFQTKRPYSGTNMLMGLLADRESPYWLTFNQAQAMGGQVVKGEKGTPMIKVGTFISKQEREQAKAEGREPQPQQYTSSFTVFNAAQIEGIDFPTPQKIDFQPVEGAERLAQHMQETLGVSISNGGRTPCYIPAKHHISMPTREFAKSEEGYYVTLFHELAHASGPALERELSGFAGGEAYAREELTAELTAAFLCAHVGLANTSNLEKSASYIQGWSQKIREDPQMLTQAAAEAQQAFDYLTEGFELRPGFRQGPDQEPALDTPQDPSGVAPEMEPEELVRADVGPDGHALTGMHLIRDSIDTPFLEYAYCDGEGRTHRDRFPLFEREANAINAVLTEEVVDEQPRSWCAQRVPFADLEEVFDAAQEHHPSLASMVDGKVEEPAVQVQSSQVEMDL